MCERRSRLAASSSISRKCLVTTIVVVMMASDYISSISAAKIGQGRYVKYPKPPGTATEIECPSKVCHCERQLFSRQIDLRCPRQIKRGPAVVLNDITFEWVYIVDTPNLRLDRKSFANLRMRRLSLAGSQLGATAWSPDVDYFRKTRLLLVELDLSDTGMDIMPCRNLRLPQLKALQLSGNNLQRLKRHCLRLLPALTSLSIKENSISTVEPGALWGLSRLEHLNLANNNLTVIERGTLRGARSMLKLDLSNNHISLLQPGAFRVLKLLQELTLAGNKLTTIAVGHFRGLRHLRGLDCSRNPLATIETGAFHPLRGLRHLSMQLAEITNADNRTLNGLRSLRTLRLHELGRSVLPPGFLGGCCNKLELLSFTNYEIEFLGLDPESLGKHIELDRLMVEVSPLYDCSCDVRWIRALTERRVRLKGRCYTVTKLSCTKYRFN